MLTSDDTTHYSNVNQNITADVVNGELLKINLWLAVNILSLNVSEN